MFHDKLIDKKQNIIIKHSDFGNTIKKKYTINSKVIVAFRCILIRSDIFRKEVMKMIIDFAPYRVMRGLVVLFC